MATLWKTRDTHGIATEAMLVLSGSTIANNDLCSADTTTGLIKPWDGTDADRLMGWHFGDSVTGAGAATGLGSQVNAKVCRGGFTVVDLTVTGLNTTTPSATANALVYASDKDSYTLISTSNVQVGQVVASRSGCSSTANANVAMDDVYGNVT